MPSGLSFAEPYGQRLSVAVALCGEGPTEEAGAGLVDEMGMLKVRATGSSEPPRIPNQLPPSCRARPRAPAPVPARSASEYLSTSCAGLAKTMPIGESAYAEPIAFGAVLAIGSMESVVHAASAPAGTFRISRPSAERILPPERPIVADEGTATRTGAIGVTTRSPDALSTEAS